MIYNYLLKKQSLFLLRNFSMKSIAKMSCFQNLGHTTQAYANRCYDDN